MSSLIHWITHHFSPVPTVSKKPPKYSLAEKSLHEDLLRVAAVAEENWEKAIKINNRLRFSAEKATLKSNIIELLETNAESLKNPDPEDKFTTSFQRIGKIWDQLNEKSTIRTESFDTLLRNLKAKYKGCTQLTNFEYISPVIGLKNPPHNTDSIDGLVSFGKAYLENAKDDTSSAKTQKKEFKKRIYKFLEKKPSADFPEFCKKIQPIWDEITSLQEYQDKVINFEQLLENLKSRISTSSSSETDEPKEKKAKKKPSQEKATGADIGLEAEAAEPSEKKRKLRKPKEETTGADVGLKAKAAEPSNLRKAKKTTPKEVLGFTITTTSSSSSSGKIFKVKKSTRKRQDNPIFDPSPPEDKAPTPAPTKSTKRKAATSNSYVLGGAPVPGNTIQEMLASIRGKTYAATPEYSKEFKSFWSKTELKKLNGPLKAEFDAYRKEIKAGKNPADKSQEIVDTEDKIFKYIVVAKAAIKKGTIVGEYIGKVIPGDKAKRADLHVFQIIGEEEGDFVISARNLCNHTAFFSHKTNCNVEFFYYDDDEGRHVLFVAKKDIEPRGILSINYSKKYWDGLGVKPIENYHYEGTI